MDVTSWSGGEQSHGLSERMDRLLRYVHVHPGVPVSTLVEDLGYSWSRLYADVGRLRSAGLLDTMRAGRRLIVYPKAADSEQVQSAAVLRGTTALRVALALQRVGEGSIERLAEASGTSMRAAYYQIESLRVAGLARCSWRGRPRRWQPTPELARAISRVAGSSRRALVIPTAPH